MKFRAGANRKGDGFEKIHVYGVNSSHFLRKNFSFNTFTLIELLVVIAPFGAIWRRNTSCSAPELNRCSEPKRRSSTGRFWPARTISCFPLINHDLFERPIPGGGSTLKLPFGRRPVKEAWFFVPGRKEPVPFCNEKTGCRLTLPEISAGGFLLLQL